MWPRIRNDGSTYPPLPLFDGEKRDRCRVDAEDQETLTQRYTEPAVQFINADQARSRSSSTSPHSMPHVPLFTTAEFKGKSSRPTAT